MASEIQKLRLTKEKKELAQRHGKIKGAPLRYPVAVETRYIADLTRLVNQMVAQTQREIFALLKPLATDAKETAEQKAKRLAKEARQAQVEAAKAAAEYRLVLLRQKFDSMFQRKAKDIVRDMMQSVTKESGAVLGHSLREMSGQVTLRADFTNGKIGAAIREGVAENIERIVSIPNKYMERVTNTLAESAMRGGDMTGLIEKLEKQGGMARRQAKNLALDQTRKAFSTINSERMKAVGVKKFEWVHSAGGAHPREYHLQHYPAGLNGGIFEMNNPPVIDENTGEKGLPAQLPNCRCVMAPVVEYEDGMFDE